MPYCIHSVQACSKNWFDSQHPSKFCGEKRYLQMFLFDRGGPSQQMSRDRDNIILLFRWLVANRTFVLYLRCGNSVLTQKVLFYFIFPYLRSPIKHCDVVVLWRCRCRDAKQLSRAQLVCLKNHRFTVITRYI